MMEEAEGDFGDGAATLELYMTLSITFVKIGFLMKKGTGLLYRPWSLRKIAVDSQNRLSYFDAETLKGTFIPILEV